MKNSLIVAGFLALGGIGATIGWKTGNPRILEATQNKTHEVLSLKREKNYGGVFLEKNDSIGSQSGIQIKAPKIIPENLLKIGKTIESYPINTVILPESKVAGALLKRLFDDLITKYSNATTEQEEQSVEEEIILLNQFRTELYWELGGNEPCDGFSRWEMLIDWAEMRGIPIAEIVELTIPGATLEP